MVVKMDPFKKLVFALFCGALPAMAQPQDLPSYSTPVLVELFTSQGCSSCPPAEKLLNSWGMGQFRKGEILPLAFHVDYWDKMGWVDPFSSPVFTARQRSYASRLSVSLYTPQMVVSGQVGFPGADAVWAKRQTGLYRGLPPVETMRLKVRSHPKGISVGLQLSPTGQWGGTYHLYWVLFENGLVTKVEGGENKGKALEENFVVRHFEPLPDLVTKGGSYRTVIPWQKAWKRSKCGVGVFLQDTATMAVRGVKWVYPIPE